MLSFPPFQLDLTEERLWRGGEELRLRRKPFAILRYLADHPRRLVTHEELVEAVWGKSVMSDSVLRSHIRALRQVLGAGIVETVVGRGYRFQVDVREVDASSQPGVSEAGAPTVDARPACLVGRIAEVAALGAALESSRHGSRQLIFVTGEAGVGKTTLVDAVPRARGLRCDGVERARVLRRAVREWGSVSARERVVTWSRSKGSPRRWITWSGPTNAGWSPSSTACAVSS